MDSWDVLDLDENFFLGLDGNFSDIPMDAGWSMDIGLQDVLRDLASDVSFGTPSSGAEEQLPESSETGHAIPSAFVPLMGPPVNPQTSSSSDDHGMPGSSKSSAQTANQRTSKGSTGVQKRTRVRVREADKIKALEAEYERKLLEYQTLAQQNSLLAYKQKTLERLVGLREYQMEFMTQNLNATSIEDMNEIPDVHLDQANHCLGAPPSITDMRIGCVAKLYLGSAPDKSAIPTVSTCEEFVQHWKKFLSECSMYVIRMQHQALSGPAASKLLDVVGPASYMCRNTSLLKPDVMEKMVRTPLDPAAPPQPSPDHWRTVLRTLDLDHDQRLQLMSAYEVFRQIMDKVRQERVELKASMAQHLQELGPTNIDQTAVPPECEMLKKVHKNLKREISAHLLMRGFLFARVLNLKQYIFMCVYSFPYFPDATAIIEVLWLDSMTAAGRPVQPLDLPPVLP